MPSLNVNYRFGFNGMEKDDQVKGRGNSYDFGARMYDSRIGRWLALDPLAQAYPDLSAYAFVAGNPILAIDPDGRKIKVVERKGFLGIGRKTVEYNPGVGYTGSNEFTKQVFESLNYIYNNDADVNGIIQDVVNHKKVIKVLETSKFGATEFNTNNNKLYFNPKEAMRVSLNSSGLKGQFQSAAIGLFHELGHGWRKLFMKNQQYSDSDVDIYNPDRRDTGYDEQYGSKEERYVNENFETPAIQILQNKGYNESIRNNHEGFPIETDGPTEIPIEDFRPPTQDEINTPST